MSLKLRFLIILSAIFYGSYLFAESNSYVCLDELNTFCSYKDENNLLKLFIVKNEKNKVNLLGIKFLSSLSASKNFPSKGVSTQNYYNCTMDNQRLETITNPSSPAHNVYQAIITYTCENNKKVELYINSGAAFNKQIDQTKKIVTDITTQNTPLLFFDIAKYSDSFNLKEPLSNDVYNSILITK